MTVSFQIEHAKSSRSTCKRCKYLIPENSLRLGKGSTFVKSWFHLACYNCEADDAAKFLKENVVDNTNGRLLSDKKEFQLILNQIRRPIKRERHFNTNSKKNSKKVVVTKKTTGKGKIANKKNMFRRKRREKVIGYVQNRDEDIVTKKFLHLCTERPEAVTQAYAKYQSMSKSRLQDQLRRNNINTKTSGNKEYYLMRVICMMRLRRSR